MLLNYTSELPLYIIGTGSIACELLGWIKQSDSASVQCVDYNKLDVVPVGAQCILGFGSVDNYSQRLVTSDNLKEKNINWCTYMHPSVVVHPTATVSPGSVICSHSVIGSGANLGEFVYVGDGGLIGHNVTVGDNAFFGPGCVIGGGTDIGSNVSVGMRSTFKDKIKITDNVIFLMTSVVTKCIETPGTYYGDRKIIKTQ